MKSFVTTPSLLSSDSTGLSTPLSSPTYPQTDPIFYLQPPPQPPQPQPLRFIPSNSNNHLNSFHQTVFNPQFITSPASHLEFQQNHLNLAIVNFFIAYGIPFNAVEHPSFRTFYEQIPNLERPSQSFFG